MKKKGFMNQVIMGDDSSKKKAAKIPSNRREVLKDVFYNSYRKLILLSLIVFVATLPLFIIIISKNIYIQYGNTSFFQDMQVDEATLHQIRIFAIHFAAYTMAIPFIMLVFIVMGGATYVIRKLVWNEVVDLLSDLKEGIKKTWKENSAFGLILGVSLNIMISNLYFLQINLEIPNTMEAIVLLISILQFVIVLIGVFFSICQAAIYQQKIWITLKNSFLFTVARFPKNILLLLLASIPYLFILVNVNFFFQVTSYLFAGIIGFSFSLVVWTLYSHSIFDLYINQKYCPELVDKGIQRNREHYLL